MLSLKCFPGPSVREVRSEAVQMCPRYPEPVQLDHPIPILKDALEKVCEERGTEGDSGHDYFSESVEGRICILPLSISGEGGGESRRWRTCESRNGYIKLSLYIQQNRSIGSYLIQRVSHDEETLLLVHQ